MYVFNGIDADPDNGTPAETFEEFAIRYREEYDDTDPLVVPVFSL